MKKTRIDLIFLSPLPGQALFVEDLPSYSNELYFAPVLSTIAHGNIVNIDFDAALQVEGVKDVVSFKDVRQGGNLFKILGDEEELVFVEKLVEYEGQMIAGVLAVNEHVGRKAAALVRVEYEALTPVVTLEQAVHRNMVFKEEGQLRLLEKGTLVFMNKFFFRIVVYSYYNVEF